jgi:phosphoserine phosphatase
MDMHQVLSTQKFSYIFESNSIQEILGFVEHDSMVIFDLDNTLVHPQSEVGSAQWFDYMLQQKVRMGLSVEDALQELLPLSFKVQNHVDLLPVENDTLHVLDKLRKKGIVTVALTARSDTLVTRTIYQLQKIGINFNAKNEFNRELTLDYPRPVLLKNGIIFCANNDKGSVLFSILTLVNYHPKKIIFVDDKLEHLLEVEKACLRNAVNFIGIRYSKLDPVVAQFDPIRAEHELSLLFGKDGACKASPE